MLKKVVFCCLILLCIGCSVKKKEKENSLNIATYIDQEDKVEINKIDNVPFKTGDKQIINYKLGIPALWLRINISKLKKEQDHVLLIGNALTDSIIVYSKKDWELKTTHLGVMIPKSKLDYKHYKNVFILNEKHSDTLYVKIKSRTALEIPVALISKEQLYRKTNKALFFSGFLYGIVCILIFYNIYLFIHQRNFAYVLYSFSAFFNLCIQALLLGHFQYYILPESPNSIHYVFYVCISLSTFFITLLCAAVLELKKKNKLLLKFTNFIAFLSLSCIPLLFFLDFSIVAIFIMIVITFFNFGILFICIHQFLKKNKIAGMLGVSWVVYLTGTAINFLRTFDIVSSNWFTVNITFTTFFAEFLMMAVIMHYLHFFRAKEKEQKQLEYTEKLDLEVQQKTKELSLALHQKNDLLSEIHHRVKNNLQIVYSLLNLQERRTKSNALKDVFEAGKNRIMAMSLVHEHLYKNNSFKKIDSKNYITELISYLSNLYGEKIDIQKKITSVSIPNDVAIPLGLIITEIVSNSFKHAFFYSEEGNHIVVVFYKKNNDLHLEISDNGKGYDLEGQKPESKQTLGIQIIKGMSQQLLGKLFINTVNGTSYHLIFPHKK
ncbi:two-component sensor histidine kinase [Aquimarina sp. MAR_2010_214]|uniref:histidine kinase dimerization/phosphoacceptor domain -containing protein n=1 Tax=Aquimarina sp. MAR_2010_214 TaxID=1250026 RepID=UPI000C714BF9|nr:histidine kinase dimerization/phosphoacceptor domain -containing protein [Aquimarina sp. MAR_2010_214]PKV49039.1 two-component sensor histidine kinase [Aquimarina sp. MAR_2010_214]